MNTINKEDNSNKKIVNQQLSKLKLNRSVFKDVEFKNSTVEECDFSESDFRSLM